VSYHHLTTFERGRIQELLSLGYSHRHIAQKLHRHRSCIDRELLRNAASKSYAGEAAQSAYETRRKNSVPKGKCTDDLVSIIEDKLLATWSPEQIANTVTLGLASFKTIYNWLYSGKLTNTSVTVLRQKGKRRKAELLLDTGNSTVWSPAAARVRAVLPHLLNGKADFTQHSRLRTELQYLCRLRLHNSTAYCQQVHSKPEQQTGEKSLLAVRLFKNIWD
jgi:hypothetical protein